MLQKLSQKLRNRKGFTLIELIVVVAIIAILIALIVPNVMRFIDTSAQTTADANAKNIYVAAQTYITDQYAAGAAVDLSDKSVLEPYVADKSMLDGATVTYTAGTGAADATLSVTWTDGNKTGTYPTPDAP